MKKIPSIIIAVLIVAAGIIVGRILSSGNNDAESNPPRAAKPLPVTSVVNSEVSRQIEMTGRVRALEKIELYAEVSGVFLDAARPFREGSVFRKGETLLRIDDRVYRNSVQSAKSSFLNQLTLLLPDLMIDFPDEAHRWKSYIDAFRIGLPVRPLPEPFSDRLRQYIAARDIYATYYDIKSMEETLEKYRLRAPFDGMVTDSEVNPGMLVRNGQRIGEFAAPDRFELAASAGIGEVTYLHEGQEVRLVSDVLEEALTGRIARVNQAVDSDTQTVGVYIEFSDPRVKDGMYMTAVLDSEVPGAVRLPRSLLQQGERIYALQDSTMILLDIDPVVVEGMDAIVRGIADSTVLLAEPVEGVYPGMPVSPGMLKFQPSFR
ncbi:efflux RND transporter periplasmic adaptor subunit [Prosthecochloris ethylica]|nr:HlyD family efflux transporter periplasmic adaptor subunit [Prosthecochloris ethylica]